MPRDEARRTLEALWRNYAESAPTVPKVEGFGPRLVLHLAAITIAFHEALMDSERSNEVASQLVADVGWVVYRKMGAVTWMLSRIAGKDKFQRMRTATQIFRHFPFSSPAYQFREVAGEANVVAFDCVRCPAAQYFASKNKSALCVRTFCNLDFPLAKDWGAELERTGSIAGGAERCDFRWRRGATGNPAE
jgi:ubiquinone biosynthesis protein